jgi:2-polyprenyl-6-methoxyphenol hydroxylase-like FAD-dependent oxidoreductase
MVERAGRELRPVVVVGAGPTGLTAALELTRFGIPVRLIDKATEAKTTSRAIGVQARTLELMEMRGLAEEFVAAGHRGLGGAMYGGGKRVARLDFTRLRSRYNYLLFLSQSQTEAILQERLEKDGVRVERGVELEALRQDAETVTAVLRRMDGGLEEVRAEYLIDAEGAHSVVRETLGLEFAGKTLHHSFILADLDVEGDLADEDFHLFASERGFLAMFPLGRRHFRLIADRPLGDEDENWQKTPREAPRLEQCQAIYDERSHISVAMRDLRWSSYFHINSRMVPQMRKGRIFLGGDAAHIHSPAAAQGMNTGMQDMINLGWKMAWAMKGWAGEELLDTYDDDRLPVIRNVLKTTERMTAMMESENRVVRGLYEHMVPLVAGMDVTQERMTELISELAVDYRRSGLSEDWALMDGIEAGDRMPDVKVKAGAGTKRMFEVLDASRCTLLVVEGTERDLSAEWQSAGQRWLNTMPIGAPEGEGSEAFAEVFGTQRREGALVLVRPDGYVALRAPGSERGRLDAWMGRWMSGSEARSAAA